MRLSAGRPVALLVALLGLSALAPAFAGEPTSTARTVPDMGTDFLISGRAAREGDWNPALAWNRTDRQYLVVWTDEREAERGGDIYGRRVSSSETVIGLDFRISGDGAVAHDRNPAVAWNETADEYLVVWQDERDLATRGADIYGRRISAAGVPIGADFRISAASGQELYPAVAWNRTENQYLVVWQDGRRAATRGDDIYGQRVSAGGGLQGSNFRVCGINAGKDDVAPALAWNRTANEYLVVWDDGRSIPDRWSDIYGRRLSGTGTPLGGDFRISGTAALGDEGFPAVVWNLAANEYLVVWSDDRKFAERSSDIYGRRVAASGARLGHDFRISGQHATEAESFPAVAWSQRSNEYLVVWQDGRNFAQRSLDIYGRQVAASGARVESEFRISGSGAVALDRYPAVAWNHSGNRYLVVREDARKLSERGVDVYGRRVDG